MSIIDSPTDLPYVLLNPPAALGFIILPPVQPGDKDEKSTGTNKKRGKYGKQLPAKYKRMFANKQIVCIEYQGISEDDEREIFRTLVHEFVAGFGTPLRSLGFNAQRDTAFRWTTWLKNAAPLDPAWKKRVQHTCKPLIDTLKAYPDCHKVSRGPVVIAPIDLVMMVLLVFGFQDKLSASPVADALCALRMSARKEKRFGVEVRTHGLLCRLLDYLEWLGEAVLGSSSGKDTHVPMDVDSPVKRQRTGDYSPTPLTTPAQSQPPPPPPPARTASTSESQRTPITYDAAPDGDRPAVALLHVHISTSYHTHVHNFPVRGRALTSASPPSMKLSARDSMFSAFAGQSLPKIDHLAATRAAKATIQGGQQQLQLYGSHPLPPRPAQAQLPRPTASRVPASQ
ncbi:hypothetical protein BJV78DRAFT_1285460 [Lactifluus subvellereus]|nr:hypothetical protein BJV78DRAFT_1285460 [Lactifluus subvellereus]